MTSLLDIGPLSETVMIGDIPIEVRGVTPEGFFYLLAKFPTLRDLFDSKARNNVSMEVLRSAAPGCIAFAISVATTNRASFATPEGWIVAVEKASSVAVNLSAHYQMAVFQAALRLTFPEGIGPFMQAMGILAKSINQVSGKAQVTTSSKPSRSGFTTDSRGLRLGRARPSGSSAH